jgi:hypothetical protein
MLTTLASREVETYNVAETAEFSIKANGKAFKVLIDGLYSDKIRAVVREIWSNAFDSHIAAGKPDEAFDCHLPTNWEPFFSVRDYGVSLSHTGVMKLYTTVFESSKEDTNTQVGKLGLGSKSPFAYVDTFTVTAWLDGKKRMYSAYIGEDYIPRISLMSEEDTDEFNGLEISFPVKQGDIHDFRIAAQRTALGFDVLPNIVGSEQLTRPTREVLAEGTGWKLYSTSDYGLRAHAKQGCVVYPIDPTAVVGISSYQSSLLKSCLFIDFPIGDLEITASREGLGYDEQTCKNIADRLEVIEREIVAQTEAKLLGATSLREAMSIANGLRTAHDLPECLRKLVERMRWRGKSLPATIYFDPSVCRGAEVVKYSRSAMGRRRNLQKQASRGTFYIDPEDVTVYFQDATQVAPNALSRIQYHFLNNPNRGDVIIVRAAPGSMAMKRVLVAMARPDTSTFIDVATLPKVPKTHTEYERKPVQVRIYNSVRSDFREWHQTTATEGIYIDMERGDLKDKNGADIGHYKVAKLVDALRVCGGMDLTDHLYVVPKSLSKILKNDGWTNLFDVVDQTIEALFDEARAQRFCELNSFFTSTYTGDFVRLFIKAVTSGEKLDVAGDAQKVMDLVSDLYAEMQDLGDQEHVLALAKERGLFTAVAAVVDLTKAVNEKTLERHYPMLHALLDHTHVDTVFNQVGWNVVVDYVTLIDA